MRLASYCCYIPQCLSVIGASPQESNREPPPYKGGALPIELEKRVIGLRRKILTSDFMVRKPCALARLSYTEMISQPDFHRQFLPKGKRSAARRRSSFSVEPVELWLNRRRIPVSVNARALMPELDATAALLATDCARVFRDFISLWSLLGVAVHAPGQPEANVKDRDNEQFQCLQGQRKEQGGDAQGHAVDEKAEKRLRA